MKHSSQMHSKKSKKEKEYLDGWQRARAELDNFRKRTHAQNQDQHERTERHVIEKLLIIADNFRALAKHIPEELKENAWAQGVLHVSRQFEQMLKEYGVSIIDKEGEVFDPNVHEAVEQVKSKKSGIVIEVIQAGYKIKDTVIRPAKVKVTK